MYRHEVNFQKLPKPQRNQACAGHPLAINSNFRPPARMQPKYSAGVEEPQISREGRRQVWNNDRVILCRTTDRGVAIEEHIFLLRQIVEPLDSRRLDPAFPGNLPQPRRLLARRFKADIVPLQTRAEVGVGRIPAEDRQLHFE